MTDEDSDIIRYITSSVETQLIRASPTEYEIDDCKKKFTARKDCDNLSVSHTMSKVFGNTLNKNLWG